MNSFLIRISVFLLILWCLIISTYLFLDYKNTKLIEAIKIDKHVKTLVVGDSHTQLALKDDINSEFH
jgi:hypothetical protein